MDHPRLDASESRFADYVEGLVSVIGHADRAKSATGLLHRSDDALRTQERGTDSGDHCAGSDIGAASIVAAFCRRRALVGREGLGQGARDGAAKYRAAWADRGSGLLTTRGSPNRGGIPLVSHGSTAANSASKTIVRSRCRCRLPITYASLPVAYRLYLPQEWTQDRERWRKAGIPKDIVFKTKTQIALDQIRQACEAGLPRGVVLMDAGYGANTDLRTDIARWG
jgi:hypothetical protein